ncbi:hypothetical protein [Thermococcus alcaliphilus]|nr:hypothetical protein [Thermococcus alcaliphilus]MCO6041295.1 hypothetical protein [Thermococcus alcaliphilus]
MRKVALMLALLILAASVFLWRKNSKGSNEGRSYFSYSVREELTTTQI